MVRERAKRLCEYCSCPERFASQLHSVEHAWPRVHGGSDSAENLVLSCQGCNNHKHSKTHSWDDLSSAIVPLFNLREVSWADHFAWSDDYAEIVPITAIGRVIVREMKLNREGRRNLRRVLYLMGEHPPT
jgi:hypothetical protein